MGVFNNYAIVPADKFMPVDVHVPGCPPRPEALMHGILKLRPMIQDDPAMGWRERYGADGTEELTVDGDGRRPRRRASTAARGDTVRCLTRPASSCWPRSCARRTPGAVLGTEHFRGKAAIHVAARRRSSRCCGSCAARATAFLASVHGVDYYPEEPRLGVHYELLDMDARRPHHASSCASRSTRPTCPRYARRGRPPTTRSARSTTCSASIFDGHPDLRRILMPEDYEGHPQRRDFPIGGEPVLFTATRPRATTTRSAHGR